MFTPGVRLIKMSKKWLIFCSIAGESKALITVEAKYLKSAPISFFEFFQKMVGLIGFGVTVCEISRVET